MNTIRAFFAACAILFAQAVFSHPHPEPVQIEEQQVTMKPGQASNMLGDCKDIGFPTIYNDRIRAAWIKHGGVEWSIYHCWAIAQIFAESSANPEAESHAGAGGLGQQIDAAERDCQLQAGMKGDRWEVQFSINCFAWLMKRNGRIFKSPRTELCRLVLARGAYISGAGYEIKAQTLARKNGRSAVCIEDGIGEYMAYVVSEESFKAFHHYLKRIDELGRRMTQ